MANKKTLEEEIIVEGNISDIFNSISTVLDRKIYKNLNIDNDSYQITANYKDGSIKGEVFVSFLSNNKETTKIIIKSTASDSISSFMSSSEVIIEMFKDPVKDITNIINSNYKKTINNTINVPTQKLIIDKDSINNTVINNNTNSLTSELTLTIKRIEQWFAINPPIKILIDGKKKYEIENGNIIEIPISYGNHNIKFSCNIRDKIIDINVIENTFLEIGFNRITGSIEINSEVKNAPYNTLCIVGVVISGISLLLNLWGIVGIAGTSTSIAGLLDCQKKNENGKALAIIGIIIGAYSILYAVYLFYTIDKQFNMS